MDYTLFVDEEIVDSSEEGDPIEFLVGRGNIIPGLEKELYGMRPGDKKTVSVSAAEGYGDFDPEAVMEISRSEFPAEIPMEVGVEISIENEDGDGTVAVIESFTDSTVTLNGNHPLAGKDLKFDVTIKGIRQPTAEELEHGHVHGEDESDCCCEDDDCDESCGCDHSH